MYSLHEQVDGEIVQRFELFRIGLGVGPGRAQHLHPALGFERLQHCQPVVLVADLLQLAAFALGRERLDDALRLGVLIALLGAGIELPAQPRTIADGADEQRRLIEEAVIRYRTQAARLDVRHPVQRIHEQPVGTFVQRNRHGVGGKVTPPQIFLDRRPVVGGLARLLVFHAVGADEVHADRAREAKVKGARGLVFAPGFSAGFFDCFLQLEAISMNGNFKLADGVPASQVAHRFPGQKYDHSCVPGRIAQDAQGVLLIATRAGFPGGKRNRAFRVPAFCEWVCRQVPDPESLRRERAQLQSSTLSQLAPVG